MSLKPIYENILLKHVDANEKSAGGIYLSQAARPNAKGEVLAIGEGYRVNGELVPLQVKVGDVVVYRKGVEQEVIDDNGDSFILLSEANVLAIA